jgi:hypothetical protein
MNDALADGAAQSGDTTRMKTFFLIVAWCLLFVLCWPLALAAIILWPLLWLLLLPIRFLGIIVDAIFVLVKTILLIPARLLGYRGPSIGRSP